MLSIIVAFDKNQLIGNNNQIPWHYKEDLQYFKEITTGKTVVMGRKTYESILVTLGKPLPHRNNIVISRKYKQLPGATCFSSIAHFLNEHKHRHEEIFIIGGSTIYKELLPYTDRLYITHIDQSFTGDTYFPDYNISDFKLIKEQQASELRFCVYERKVKHHE